MQPSLLWVAAYVQAVLRLHRHPVLGCAELSGCLLPAMRGCPASVDADHPASVGLVHRARAKAEAAYRLDLMAMRQDVLAVRRHRQRPAEDAERCHQGIRYRDILRTAFHLSFRFRHMQDKPYPVEVEAECRHAENLVWGLAALASHLVLH